MVGAKIEMRSNFQGTLDVQPTLANLPKLFPYPSLHTSAIKNHKFTESWFSTLLRLGAASE